MAKFGYVCLCGWRLTRTGRTRIQYALAKQNHALGLDQPDKKGCKYLAAELARTQHDSDIKRDLLAVR